MRKDENDTKKKSTQFWKQVSKGLRMPLNVIKGTADIAQGEIYDIETVKEGFRKIEESSEFLLNVVNDIVDFVTIENDELEIAQQPFNLNAMITQFIAKYFNKATSQKKHLDAQIHGVLHERLVGDEHRFEQILDCMLSNGLKYTSENDCLYFEIFETGISEDRISMRFTMTCTNRKMYDFLTGTVNGKVVTEATDLALYNSHYILLKMGGFIKVILDENENSKIIIDMTFGQKEGEPRKKSLFENERILIVCDNKKEAEARGELLVEMNAFYETAADSEEALEKIGEAEEKGKNYSACVVDWNVKNFSIQEFVNDVRNIFGSQMTLIAMAYNVEKVREQAEKIGFDYVMDHTWFRSTICEVLMKNTQGVWKSRKTEEIKKKYDFSNKHILVAEDAPLNMKFIEQILTNVHADVISASNGLEAYNLFKQKPENYFDCVLMDINMPEMDGYEAAKNIRKIKRKDAASVPIFALTANAFQSDIREALEAGMNGHFSKPVDIDRMYQVLGNLFDEMRKGTYDGKTETENILDELNAENKQKKDQQDAMTGLLSLYGLSCQVDSRNYIDHPVGFLMIEIKNLAQILEKQGKTAGDQLLYRLAEELKEEFRTSDLLARYSEECFAVVLNYCFNGIEFAEIKIQNIIKKLNQNPDLEKVEICCGAAYSENGYSKVLTSLAFEALTEAKQTEKHFVSIDESSLLDETGQPGILNKMMFGTEMFYLKGKQIAEVDHAEEVLERVLGANQAVGIMCGLYDEGLTVTSASGFALKNLGYDAESFVKETKSLLTNVVYPDDREALLDYVKRNENEVKKLRFKFRNGSVLWFSIHFVQTETKKKDSIWIASFRPFDENIVGNLCDIDYVTVSVLLPDENTIIMEKGAETIYPLELKLRKKYNYESLLHTVFVHMHKESDREEFLYSMSLKNIRTQLEQKGIYEFITYQTRENGESIPLRYKYRYIDRFKKEILVTQEYVENFAESDDVTSLLNEKGFFRNVKKTLQMEENAEKKYVILYINIKDFKTCNEMLGFSNGNELLRYYADYIEKSELKPVCCARFHADQFYFLIESDNLNYDIISESCYKKVTINGRSFHIRLHCGIYEIKDREQEVSTMCDKAVLAAESITNEYAMPYYIFDESVEKRYQNRIFVLNNLDRAFVRNEFQVYYQPVCDVKTGKVCSAEALVRWIMPGGKVVSPGVFVPVLENKGFISKLDLLIASKVQQFTESRVSAGKNAVPVSINLSRMDFLNDTFISDLRNQISQIQTDKSLFRYEVTESAYINVGEEGRKLVDEIRNNHSQIYIDDFGTGYSSLQNLMEIRFDVLKLDMYFIRRIGNNAIAEGVIDAAIHVCHGLGRKIIAEGVETEEQYRFLAERGCDYIQGYYFYKPMSEKDFAELLDREK